MWIVRGDGRTGRSLDVVTFPSDTPLLRTEPDACPGALQVHDALDGSLARVRLPGGRLTSSQLGVLATAAEELSDGNLVLTSRGNIQFRAVTDSEELARRLAEAGLLPSETHERVRNIVASPLTGRLGGLADVRDLVTGLDEGLVADADLSELPGRILFSVDDGRGDVSGMGADIGVHAVDGDRFAVMLAGADSGVRVGRSDAVRTMLDAARAFRTERDGHWRIGELAGGSTSILRHLGEPVSVDDRVDLDANAEPPIGWFVQDDATVALGATVAHGLLPARTAQFLAAVERDVVITPWRSLVVVDLDEWAAEQVVRVLAPMGLIFDADSPWARVSSCVGTQGCAKSRADVRSDLDAAVEAGNIGTGREHWVGCERRCGRPRGDVTDVVATGDGYDRTAHA